MPAAGWPTTAADFGTRPVSHVTTNYVWRLAGKDLLPLGAVLPGRRALSLSQIKLPAPPQRSYMAPKLVRSYPHLDTLYRASYGSAATSFLQG